ncbi:MAG: PAS domain-containing protein [Polyangiales bacterium]
MHEASVEAWLREAALACHPAGILILDRAGRAVFANRAAELALGIEPGGAVGKDLADASIGLAPLGAALARGETIHRAEHVARRANGNHVILEVDGAPICDGSGVHCGAVASLRPRSETVIPPSFETSLQTFLDAMLTPVVIHFEGRVEYANPATLAMLACEERDLVGHDMTAFIPPEDLPLLRERLQATTGTAQPIREARFITRDGLVVHVESTSVLLQYRGKTCVVSIGRDVTQARQQEAARERMLAEIDAQRQLFRAIFDEVPAGIAIVNGTSFAVEMINPAFRAFAPAYSMDGERLGDVVGDLRELLPILNRVMASGEPEHVSSMPIKIRRTPGGREETGYFTFAVARVRSPLGEHLAILGMAVETTEEVKSHRRAAELAEIAQNRAAELESIIETMGDAVFVSDRSGALTLANQAGLRLLGVDSLAEASAMLGERPAVFHLRRADGAPTLQEATPLSRALAGESVSLDPETVVGRDGREVFVRANARPIRAGGGAIVGAVEVAMDVSPLVEFDRLKDQFIRVAAHELKTPIAIMKGYAQALLRSTEELTATARVKLEAVNRGAERMDRAVRKLLDLSQLHLGRLRLTVEDLDLDAIVERVVAKLTPTLSRHRLVVQGAGRHIARADGERIEYVISGLVDNAIVYSPEGGDIDIEVSDNDAETVLSVRDRGVGVPADRQSHLFERFYRAHTDTAYDFGGMGVDLFLCREMVNRMGGRMWFESEEGRGSTFHVALPKGTRRRAA